MEQDFFIENEKNKIRTINIDNVGKLSNLLSDWEKKILKN